MIAPASWIWAKDLRPLDFCKPVMSQKQPPKRKGQVNALSAQEEPPCDTPFIAVYAETKIT